MRVQMLDLLFQNFVGLFLFYVMSSAILMSMGTGSLRCLPSTTHRHNTDIAVLSDT